MATLQLTSTYTLIVCGADGCNLRFAVPDEWLQQRQDDHRAWYCPDGHGRVYAGPSKQQKLERELADARRSLSYARASASAARDQAAAAERSARAAERSARAYRGVATRVKNRAAHGVCPVPGCKRSFANVARHVAGQHPEFVPEVGAQS